MKLLVYGTLKKGFSNHKYLLDSKYIKNITIKGTLLFNNERYFPHLILKGNNDIDCEVYEVSDNVFSMLDRLEGHPYFFKRTLLFVDEFEEYTTIYEYIFQQNETIEDFIEINEFKEI